MLRLLLDTIRLNPLDLYPGASYEPMRENNDLVVLRRNPKRNTKYFPRTTRLLSLVRHGFHGLIRPGLAPEVQPGTHLMFGLTHNQRVSLEPVLAKLNEHQTIAKMLSGDQMRGVISRSSLVGLLFLPFCLMTMFRSHGYQRQSFRWAIDDYCRGYGMYLLIRRWYRRTRPKSVTVSNDHVLLPCVLMRAARDEGIKTFYVQHACVTKKFPPLACDFALLDGLDASVKYRDREPGDTKRFLIGMPKFDRFRECVNDRKSVSVIGVCFSNADDFDRCRELLAALSDVQVKVIVRPHMGMPSAQQQKFRADCERFGFELSKHAEEVSFDFLGRIDLLISGTSAIALEAVLLNIPSINFVLCQETPDWYGFIQNGLTQSTSDLEQLRSWLNGFLQKKPNVRHLAKRYCATVDTGRDGDSAALAAGLISSLGENRDSLRELGDGIYVVQ